MGFLWLSLLVICVSVATQGASFGNSPDAVSKAGPMISGPYLYSDNAAGNPLPNGQFQSFEFYAEVTDVSVRFLILQPTRPPNDFTVRHIVSYTPRSVGRHTVPFTGASVNNDRFGFYVASGRVPLPYREDSSYYSTEDTNPQVVTADTAVKLPALAGKAFALRVNVITVSVTPTAAPTTSSVTMTTSHHAFQPPSADLAAFGNQATRVSKPGADIAGPYTYSDNSIGSPLPSGTVHVVEFYIQSAAQFTGFYFVAYNAVSPPREFTVAYGVSVDLVQGLNVLEVFWPVNQNDRMGFHVASGTVPMAHRVDSSYYSTEGFSALNVRSGETVKLNQLAGKVFPFRFLVSSVAPPTTVPTTSLTTSSTAKPTSPTTSGTNPTTPTNTIAPTTSPSGSCPIICPPGPPGPPGGARRKRDSYLTFYEDSSEDLLQESNTDDTLTILTQQVSMLQKWLLALTVLAASTSVFVVHMWRSVISTQK